MKKRHLQSFRIAEYVREHTVRSRADIADALEIGLPAAGRLVRDLMERGVLVQDGFDESSGGRPRARVRLNATAGFAVGVHVAMRGIRAAIVDLGGRLLAASNDPVPATGSVNETLDAISRAVEGLTTRKKPGALLGVGIGVSGIIREGGRVSREFPHAERWHNAPLADTVEARCGIRPLVLNDVHAAALGELRFGACTNVRDLVFLHVGDGIGAGIVANGRLCQGGTRNAGEVGHIILAEDGPICYCGNRGCLESMASPGAIVEACRDAAARGVRTGVMDEAADPTHVTFDHVLRAAARGDRLASNLLTDAGRRLGQVAASLITVFDPQVLMLGGILAAPRNELVDALERTVHSRVLPMLREATRIEVSTLRESASMLGAGALVLDQTFADPAAFAAAYM